MSATSISNAVDYLLTFVFPLPVSYKMIISQAVCDPRPAANVSRFYELFVYFSIRQDVSHD